MTEHERLQEVQNGNWRKWGPYLSERQWGTVREDYSTDGNAWDYFSHDQARSRAYRWGEDGLRGISDDKQRGGNVEGLKEAFRKLLLNFTWWVNRKDRDGKNIFEGGFLGLDNIGVFDRSAPLPNAGTLEQADGTAWMCFFCQNMLELALELAKHDRGYEDIASKFLEHFFWIGAAMDRLGINDEDMWDEEDGFFYDVLVFPDGSAQRIKTRSMVGLLPLCATTAVSPDALENLPGFARRTRDFVARHQTILSNMHRRIYPA